MSSAPLIALALSVLLGAVPFAPASETAPEPPALSAEEQAALTDLAQTPAAWFEEQSFADAIGRLPHYDEVRLSRYLAYRTKGSWTLEQVLRIVNTDNDLPRYTAAADAELADGNLILVNKYSRLASDYVPDDLVTVEPAYSNGGKLKSEVNDAFCDLVEALWAETGLHLVNISPYRSYSLQSSLYARYSARDGAAAADRYSAHAGYSEHQTGLALDVSVPGGTLNGFKKSKQFEWMRDNAHRFGFILRYGEGMEYITGYKFEPWHYRYVGTEAAAFIYENGLTFEEYYAYYVRK
ncbi:M15 family metallopeptidase [Oscillibacter valericigenes]|nr:M15 family metallopeptidase [Oscillibacter valericigenes]